MVNEKITDDFISRLLRDAEIDYTPNGSSIKQIQDALMTASKRGTGKSGFPEFVAKSGDFIIVIEDKAKISKQALYLENVSNKLNMNDVSAITDFAENGALHYANHIIENTNYKKIFAFGCSGNESHHIIRPIFVDENGYKILNEIDNFKNFNEENIDRYYQEIVLELPSPEEIKLETLIKQSNELNDYLRDYGQLGDTEKPLVVSAILLALTEKPDLLNTLNGDKIKKDGEKIYDEMETHLTRVNVGDKKSVIQNQFNLIKDYPKLNKVEKTLDGTPLRYFTEKIKEYIFPSISHSEVDILGYFYSTFIKYSSVDGKSLGIVLTPKHITDLFCDLLEIKPTDKILDPCCGTGSFLISALNKMVKQANNDEEINNIKQNNLHGIEIRPHLYTIGATNMILRGDGKSNLKLCDFFDKRLDLRKEKYTVGLMNPPYSQGGNLSEMHFIIHLLDSLEDNGKCAVIVPQSVMTGNNGNDDEIKKNILKKHTLEGVISLNKDTVFRGKGVHPCIAIFTAHTPHPPEKRCKFINFEDDGYELRPHVGIVETERAIERKEHLLQCWKDNKDAESKFMIKTTIKDTDEWLHAFYYFNDEIPSENSFNETLEDYISFELEMVLKNRDYLFKE